jgi:hypothetical protein
MHKGNFAYVQWFSPPKRTPERDINMYMVSRMDEDGERRGAIIPMSTIARFVQLIPKFGSNALAELTAQNSMDICRDYYINSFADKEIYQAVW